jgi:hypothetical protein
VNGLKKKTTTLEYIHITEYYSAIKKEQPQMNAMR